MDKVIKEEKEFIQNFALELTNRTLKQREEIGKKYYKQLKRLQAENERLKAENGEQRIEIYKQGQSYLKASDKAYNYRQALQEIREIAESVCKDDCPDLQNGYCIGLGECSFRARKQIITKINEVIGAE